jgi:hypothetical protein
VRVEVEQNNEQNQFNTYTHRKEKQWKFFLFWGEKERDFILLSLQFSQKKKENYFLFAMKIPSQSIILWKSNNRFSFLFSFFISCLNKNIVL